jgi:hypothetical protein
LKRVEACGSGDPSRAPSPPAQRGVCSEPLECASRWRSAAPSNQPAGIFRIVEAWRPTLLIDEADTLNLGQNDGVRGILNSGHRRNAKVIRCEGDNHEPRAFAVFGACVLALIGDLPDTLASRSIVIELRRAKPGEVAKQYRFGRTSDLDQLASMARRWADDHRAIVAAADPPTEGLFNRDADNWRALFAIADVAGGEWPQVAREAGRAACKQTDEQSVRAMLLSDIRDIRDQQLSDRNPQCIACGALGGDRGRPWGEWKGGRSITQHALARQLSHFSIYPRTVRDGQATFKGYLWADFDDAFDRYLRPLTVTSSQTQQSSQQLSYAEPSLGTDALRFESANEIEHHKTGAVVWHPLEEATGTEVVKFYEDAESVLARLPRRGVPMILREVRDGVSKPYSFGGMQKIVQTMRAKLGLPSTFTLDACRHGGMTELEEAELTDGQGRALSAHKSQQAYEGYAKRTMERALSATRKRHAHRLTNAQGTFIQNERQSDVQNEAANSGKLSAK